MTMVINGDGSITGLVSGGLPDATITQPDLASGVAGTGPAFSAYMSANQSISNNTATKVAFNTEQFDTNSSYDNTTYRFTPLIAGYYQVQILCFFNIAPTTGINAQLNLYKNGSVIAKTYTSYASPSAYYPCMLTTLVYLNGSTDYIEAYIYQGSGSSQNLGNGGAQSDNLFQASLARAV